MSEGGHAELNATSPISAAHALLSTLTSSLLRCTAIVLNRSLIHTPFSSTPTHHSGQPLFSSCTGHSWKGGGGGGGGGGE